MFLPATNLPKEIPNIYCRNISYAGQLEGYCQGLSDRSKTGNLSE